MKDDIDYRKNSGFQDVDVTATWFAPSEPSGQPGLFFFCLSHIEFILPHTCCVSVTFSGDVFEEQRAGAAHCGAARHRGGELRRAHGG